MRNKRVLRGAVLLRLAVALPLTQCTPAVGDDDGGSGTGGSAGSGVPSAGSGTTGGSGAGGVAGASGAGGSAPGSGGAGIGGGTSGGMSSGGALSSGGSGAATCQAATPLPVGIARPAPVDQATFDAKWPALVCTALKPCCASKGTPYDEAKCLAFAATFFEEGTTYDANEGGLCIQSLELAAESCAGDLGYRGVPGACMLTYRGTFPLGELCDEGSDCAPDPRGYVECGYSELAGDSACLLEIRGKVGDPCDEGCEIKADHGVCHIFNDQDEQADPNVLISCKGEDGLMCDGVRGCVPTVGLGCPCFFSAGDCNGQTQCKSDSGSVCEPRGGAGTPCTLNLQCTLDNYCPSTDGTAVCTPRKHASEPCTDHNECVGGNCLLGACNLDNGDGRFRFRDVFCDGIGTET
jgi:hypothetical protein